MQCLAYMGECKKRSTDLNENRGVFESVNTSLKPELQKPNGRTNKCQSLYILPLLDEVQS
jgi:hypothetical protein